ncbi:Crp/Fnr family transcriptional regulator, partial [Bacteroides acidifaciens]
VNKESVKTNIIAATDAEVIQCSVTVLKHQLANSPELHRILAEGLFRQAYMRYLDLHGSSPKARYLALLKRCPDILQNITLKEMASYLQITPTHLSRIRKELTFTNNTLE